MKVFNIGDNALMYSVCFLTNLVSVLNCFQVNLQTFDTVVVFGVQEMVSTPTYNICITCAPSRTTHLILLCISDGNFAGKM